MNMYILARTGTQDSPDRYFVCKKNNVGGSVDLERGMSQALFGVMHRWRPGPISNQSSELADFGHMLCRNLVVVI